MNQTITPRFFLGANSPGGFLSLYDELIDRDTARDVYILKGGPGCGKSTLMRKVAQQLEQEGIPREEILCSSDPKSLDGVVFPSLAAAIVDGTAPHVQECLCPAAVDIVVNLGAFYDREALRPLAPLLRSAMESDRRCRERVTRCLSAARILREDLRSVLLPYADLTRLDRRIRNLASRELKRAPSGGSTRRRFLSGLTPQGTLFLRDTVTELCPRILLLSDTWGLSPYVLSSLLEYAQQRGIETIVCCCPQDTSLTPEHLLFPTLGLAVLTESPELPWDGPFTRRLRLDPFFPASCIREHRSRLRLERKMADALYQEAADALQQASQIHNRIESYYNPHVDFDGVDREAQRIAQELLRHR